MVTFRAPNPSFEGFEDYPQMIVLWHNKQVGIARELGIKAHPRWEFHLMTEPGNPVAFASHLMDMAHRITLFMETWEAHDSIYEGLAAAKALPLKVIY